MSLNDRLRVVANGLKDNRTKELIVFYLFGVIQNLRLEFWRI